MDHKDSSNNYPTIKDFVLQEALEKAFEINVLGLKDFEKAKSEMLLERQDALHQELDKKHKEQLAAQRIHKSSLINRSRMQKMEMRHK
jgi:vacuolar-type H+-ATPase subunit E/Vma4